jgi:hypothetical protein
MTRKNRKRKFRKFMFLRVGCSFLRVEGFSCSLDVLPGVLRIKKSQILIVNRFFSGGKILQFCHQNPGSGSGTGSGSGSTPRYGTLVFLNYLILQVTPTLLHKLAQVFFIIRILHLVFLYHQHFQCSENRTKPLSDHRSR